MQEKPDQNLLNLPEDFADRLIANGWAVTQSGTTEWGEFVLARLPGDDAAHRVAFAFPHSAAALRSWRLTDLVQPNDLLATVFEISADASAIAARLSRMQDGRLEPIGAIGGSVARVQMEILDVLAVRQEEEAAETAEEEKRFLPAGFQEAAKTLGYGFFQTKPRRTAPGDPYRWAGWSMRLPHPDPNEEAYATLQLWVQTQEGGPEVSERFCAAIGARNTRHLLIPLPQGGAWEEEELPYAYAGWGESGVIAASLQNLPARLLSQSGFFKTRRNQPDRPLHDDLLFTDDGAAREPKLGFPAIAEEIVAVVEEALPENRARDAEGAARTPEEEASVTIGLYGAWGAGKSSLINALRDAFPRDKYYQVPLNAWKWDGKQDLHAYVRKAVLRTVGERILEERLGALKGLAYWKLWASVHAGRLFWWIGLGAVGLALVAVAALALFDFLTAAPTPAPAQPSETAPGVMEPRGVGSAPAGGLDRSVSWAWNVVAGWLAGGGLLAAILGKAMTGLFNDFLRARLLTGAERDHRADLERTYRDIAAIGRFADARRRLVFFVDDLDRCTPERVADFVESVHSLTAAGCVAILACDEDYVAAALNARHKAIVDFHPDGPAFGDRFLEKIVQVGYRVPALDAAGLRELGVSDPEARLALMRRRFETAAEAGEPPAEAGAPRLADEPEAAPEHDTDAPAQEIDPHLLSEVMEELLQDYVVPLGLTPRTVKSVYNTVRLHLRIAGRLGRIDVADRARTERLAAFLFADRVDPRWLDAYRLDALPAERERYRDGAFAGYSDLQTRLAETLGPAGDLDDLYRLIGRQPRVVAAPAPDEAEGA